QGDVAHPGDADGVRQLRLIQAHQLAGRDGGRDRPVGDVIDAVRPQAGGIAEPALHLVGEDRGGDEVTAAGPDRLPDGEHRGEVVARVGRLFRQVRVVEVEVADE